MPETELADKIHAKGYRGPREDFREWGGRCANALKDDDDHFHALRSGLLAQRILPGGRIQAGAGSPRRVTMFNCYVMPTIEDSFFEGENSIDRVATKAGITMRMGGGVGYDFSTLRPEGALIRSLGSQSSGPVAFMEIYDAYCRATASAGNRRGAQMAVLRIDHPDIEKFIRCKQNDNKLNGFNISVAVTDEFMRAVEAGDPFNLRFNGEVYQTIDARSLWEEIMRSTWDWAEPGVLFIDTINRMNNLWYCETIAATNPCGEQPLPPNGACLLGSTCLPKYVKSRTEFDFEQLDKDLKIFHAALDNVIDRTIYPLPEQLMEAKTKRRMGVGVTGLANALEAMGMPYGSPHFLEMEAQILEFQRDRLYTHSAIRAAELGPFPEFKRDEFLDGEFARTLSPAVRDLIAKYGLRNSHLTSIAPTGTISLCADNVSSGIEPVFSYRTERDIRWDGRVETHKIDDYGYAQFGVRGRQAVDVSVDEHLAVIAVAQKYVDSSVSKTSTMDPYMSWDAFKDVYFRAWDLGLKGITTYTPPIEDEDGNEAGGKRQGIMRACEIDPDTGEASCEL